MNVTEFRDTLCALIAIMIILYGSGWIKLSIRNALLYRHGCRISKK